MFKNKIFVLVTYCSNIVFCYLPQVSILIQNLYLLVYVACNDIFSNPISIQTTNKSAIFVALIFL